MRVSVLTKSNAVEIEAKMERFTCLNEIDEAIRALQLARAWFIKESRIKGKSK